MGWVELYSNSNIKNHDLNLIEFKCQECGGDVVNNGFERTCTKCGLVVEEILSEQSYIISNSESGNMTNKQYVALGEQVNFVGGLGTCIDYEKSYYLRDKNGNLLSPSSQKLFQRLKKNYTKFVRIKNYETEYRILKILNKIAILLNLNNNIRNNAAYFYRKIAKKSEKIINNISLIAFCLFYSLRKDDGNVPLSIKEVAEAFQILGHRVTPRLIIRDGMIYKKYLDKNDSSLKSERYLSRLIEDIVSHEPLKERLKKKGIDWDLSEYKRELTNVSETLLKYLKTKQRGGRNPLILAGAIIYCADK